MLDGVLEYLPNPSEIANFALDESEPEKPVKVQTNPERSGKHKALSLAFKLESGKYGQLTYMRVYQGCLKTGDYIYNVRTGKKHKLSRLVRMHSNHMEVSRWFLCTDIYFNSFLFMFSLKLSIKARSF